MLGTTGDSELLDVYMKLIKHHEALQGGGVSISSSVLPSVFSFLTLASWASSHFFFPCYPYLYLHLHVLKVSGTPSDLRYFLR